MEAFVVDIFNADAGVVAYTQKLLGYAITGHMNEQVWVIWTGSGSNGKGLLLAMLEALLGPVFFKTAKKEVFFKAERGRAAGAAEPHLVELRGARIAAKDESSASNQLDIEHIKAVTGQSSLTVRDNYQGYITFKPTFIPLLLCNELPHINVDEKSELRRVVVECFPNTYTTPGSAGNPYDPANPTHRRADSGMYARMTSRPVLQQFLTWLVQGAVRWAAEGLGSQPDAMRECFQQYVQDNDTLAEFIAEACDVAPGLKVNAKEFRELYCGRGEHKVSAGQLKKMMERRGFPWHTTGGVYSGLSWKP